MKIFKLIPFVVCLFLTLFVMPMAKANPIPIMPIDEVKIGMHGIGKTVISGTKIEDFDVQVLGVSPSAFGRGNAILVKVTGDVIERAGGVAKGMSGSPVFVDGKLIGAVAYMKMKTDPHYIYLTAIEDMLSIIDEPMPRPSEYLTLGTDFMVSGLTPKSVEYLKNQFKELNDFDLNIVAAPTLKDELKDELKKVKMQPGSSCSVMVADGDVTLGAIGTVTWTDDDGRYLAFGHTFNNKGAVDYFLGNAWIYKSVQNLDAAYKIGVPGLIVGNVTQDRATGIAGKIGAHANFIPLFISATDSDRGINEALNERIVTDESMVPALAAALDYNTANKAIDRVGDGTARVDFHILASGEKSGKIKIDRENMFYDSQDIASKVTEEVAGVLDVLMHNKFEKFTIFDVKINNEITKHPDIAEIESVQIRKDATFKPGETISLKVNLKPYRAETISKIIDFTIPKDTKPGKINLIVRGGGDFEWLRSIISEKIAKGKRFKAEKASIESFVKTVNTADQNNELIVDVLPEEASLEYKSGIAATQDEKADPASIRKMLRGTKAKMCYATSFIVSGETEIKLKVVK
jgi:hypothetical protein